MKMKKVFQPIIDLLNVNLEASVTDILPSVMELCAVGVKGTRETKVKRDADGNPTEIFCYYHAEWEKLEDVSYGTKKGSTTGFSNMCKLGSTQWSRQKRVADKATTEILNDVMEGTLAREDIQARKDEIEAERTIIVPLEVLVERALEESADTEVITAEDVGTITIDEMEEDLV